MAENDINYPLPRFRFKVDWGGAKMYFTEVTGLVMEREKIEFRHSDSPSFNKQVMPGLSKNNNITLKRGKFENDVEFEGWFKKIKGDRTDNPDIRRNVTITLENEKGTVVAEWKAKNCFPVKVSGPDLKSDANEIAIESLEIAHEGLNLEA